MQSSLSHIRARVSSPAVDSEKTSLPASSRNIVKDSGRNVGGQKAADQGIGIADTTLTLTRSRADHGVSSASAHWPPASQRIASRSPRTRPPCPSMSHNRVGTTNTAASRYAEWRLGARCTDCSRSPNRFLASSMPIVCMILRPLEGNETLSKVNTISVARRSTVSTRQLSAHSNPSPPRESKSSIKTPLLRRPGRLFLPSLQPV